MDRFFHDVASAETIQEKPVTNQNDNIFTYANLFIYIWINMTRLKTHIIYFLVCLTILIPHTSQGQIITTVAGNGINVYSGDGGSFVVQLREKSGTAHIVVSNTLGQTIKEINTTDRHNSIMLDAPPGMYFVRVNACDKSWSRKIVVR